MALTELNVLPVATYWKNITFSPLLRYLRYHNIPNIGKINAKEKGDYHCMGEDTTPVKFTSKIENIITRKGKSNERVFSKLLYTKRD